MNHHNEVLGRLFHKAIQLGILAVILTAVSALAGCATTAPDHGQFDSRTSMLSDRGFAMQRHR